MGKRDWDDEQRRRMRDLKRWSSWEVLTGGALLVLAVVAGVLLRDDWTALLLPGSMGLLAGLVVFVSQWRYIRRGPFPRLPASMRARGNASSDEDRTAGQGG